MSIEKIQAEIKKLEDELSLEYETERMREAEVEKARVAQEQAEAERLDRENEARWARQRAQRKEDEARERVESHQRIARVFALLPPPEIMPLSRCCGKPLDWPMDSFPWAPNSAPDAEGRITLQCSGCGSRWRASFDSPAFPRRFE